MANTTEQDAGAALMMKVRRRVEEFLNDVAETDPNKLDVEQLEGAALEIVKELGLGLMQEVFRRADEVASEVTVNGATWGGRKVTPGTYTVKFGTFKLDRAGYQQRGRGRVMFPVDQRLGIVEGRYSPAMARMMARTIAEMPPERGEAYLAEVGLGEVSSSTLHRIPQDMEAVYELDRAHIEAVVRGEARVPKAAYTVQVGMDGVMVPMDSEHAKRRGRPTEAPDVARHERHYGPVGDGPADSDGKNGAAYHEASVGTLTFFDRDGEHIETVYRARMPEYRKETLAAELEAELTSILEQRPDIRVAFASDGAETHWEHLQGMRQRLPAGTESRELLDFCHGAKYLFDAAKLVEEDEGAAFALAEEWRSKLRHRKDGADVVIRALRYQRDEATSAGTRDQLDTIVDFFADHHRNGRLAYRQAANDAFPIGTGPTEAAAKTVVTVRMKRAGARYNSHGGQTVLTFRAALLSHRFDATMREVVARYSAKVIAA
jgi:hypothetical protein